jgi:hypothetical protein
MEVINVEALDKLLLKGQQAAHFAWDNYEELCARKKTYTLYGPEAYGIGAGIPCGIVSKSSRKLSKQTHRRNYKIYELDKDFHLLRTVTMWNYREIRYCYQCFEMDGIQFACSFAGNQKRVFRQEVLATSYQDNQPQWFAFLTPNSVKLETYCYVSPSKVNVNSYLYSRVSKYSWHGYPVDFSVPIGTASSPIAHGSWEAEANNTDFSVFFKTGDDSVS